MVDKKIQVFVSSTFKDLIKERNEIVVGILKSGHIPAGMELFSAVGSQLEVIKRTIDRSDAYCLIMGSRYGTIDKETGNSYTELEYQYAKERNIPIFVLVMDEGYLQEQMKNGTLNIHDIQINNSEYTRFKLEVMEEHLVAIVNHISAIKGEVQSCLQTIIKEHGESLIGWVPGSLVTMAEQKDEQFEQLLKKLSGKDIRIKDLEHENAQIKVGENIIQQNFTEYVKELARSKDGNDKTKETINFLRTVLNRIVKETKRQISDELNLLKHNHDGDTYKMATIDLKDRSIIFKANYEVNEISVMFSEKNIKSPVYQEVDKLVLSEDVFVSKESGEKIDLQKVNGYLKYLYTGEPVK